MRIFWSLLLVLGVLVAVVIMVVVVVVLAVLVCMPVMFGYVLFFVCFFASDYGVQNNTGNQRRATKPRTTVPRSVGFPRTSHGVVDRGRTAKRDRHSNPVETIQALCAAVKLY